MHRIAGSNAAGTPVTAALNLSVAPSGAQRHLDNRDPRLTRVGYYPPPLAGLSGTELSVRLVKAPEARQKVAHGVNRGTERHRIKSPGWGDR